MTHEEFMKALLVLPPISAQEEIDNLVVERARTIFTQRKEEAFNQMVENARKEAQR